MNVNSIKSSVVICFFVLTEEYLLFTDFFGFEGKILNPY